MARSTRSSLADTAKAAARKVLPKRSSNAPADEAAPATKKAAPATKKAAPATKKAAPATKKAAPSAKKAAPSAKKAATKKAAPATKKAAPATKKAAPATKKSASSAKKAATKAAATKKTAASAKAAPGTTKAPPARKSAQTATKSGAGALVVKDDEGAWTTAELDEVVADLHQHRDRLRAVLHDQEEELAGLMRDAGDGAGHDQADVGASSFERDHELTVLANEREMLAQIERALGRIDDGTYGVCESCGQPIGKNRLMAFPRATLCMTCKQREERR